MLLIRRIRELLYEEGFTISGARNRLDNALSGDDRHDGGGGRGVAARAAAPGPAGTPAGAPGADIPTLKRELRDVLDTLR